MRLGVMILTRNGEGYDGRFPGKGMAELFGKSTTLVIIEKALSLKTDGVIMAIPDTRDSDVLRRLGEDAGIQVYQGDPVDILDRQLRAMRVADFDMALVWSGDCPLAMNRYNRPLINAALERGPDWWVVDLGKSYCPMEGSVGGVYSIQYFESLRKIADRDSWKPSQREQPNVHAHRTPGYDEELLKHTYSVELPNGPDKTKTDMKLSIDYPLELAVANKVCRYLGHLPESMEEVDLAYRSIHSL